MEIDYKLYYETRLRGIIETLEWIRNVDDEYREAILAEELDQRKRELREITGER